MKVTPFIAPVLNSSAMSLDLRRELSEVDLSNAFGLSKFIPDVDRLLYFCFIIEGLLADQIIRLVEPTDLRFAILKINPPTDDFPVETKDIVISGSAAQFQQANIKEVKDYLRHYKKQVGGI